MNKKLTLWTAERTAKRQKPRLTEYTKAEDNFSVTQLHNWPLKLLLAVQVVPDHTIEAYCRSRGISPLILNLGTSWRRVLNFTPRPLCSRERAHVTQWVGPRADLEI
jgi:hypothetical protein